MTAPSDNPWERRITALIAEERDAQQAVCDLQTALLYMERCEEEVKALAYLAALADGELTGTNERTREAQFLAYLRRDAHSYAHARKLADNTREELRSAQLKARTAHQMYTLGMELLRNETARIGM